MLLGVDSGKGERRMIHVIDDFYIKVGQLDFTLLRKTNSINKKTDEITYKVLGYYSSVFNAVEGIKKIMSRELTAEKDIELYEAVTAFKQIAERLEKATEGLR